MTLPDDDNRFEKQLRQHFDSASRQVDDDDFSRSVMLKIAKQERKRKFYLGLAWFGSAAIALCLLPGSYPLADLWPDLRQAMSQASPATMALYALSLVSGLVLLTSNEL